ncbi:sigma-54 interaction domain-containing protein [Acidovorax sp. SDU_ACID1]|uniref:sigma-54 interaction domain-containing protein n=1 Tax=Acidovorax sp. SDU_ACID1 TaxID=3136632 RepID=UPI003873AB1B
MKRESEGVLVLDAGGAPVFACGLGRDELVARSLGRLWHNRDRVPLKRLVTLTELERPLTVAAIPSPEAVCFLVFALPEGDELSEFIAAVDAAPDILRHFVTDPYKAIVVVDTSARITYMSPVHEKFFGLKHGESFGRPVTSVIENTKLQEVVATGKGQVAQLQEMNGVTRVVSRLPVFDRGGRVVAAIGQVMFKGPEAMRALTGELAQVKQELAFYRRELSGLRNRSYGLDQIIGRSDAVRRLKEDILRVAPLDVPVLLTGESGTGKEMVAHAIHMLSPRSDKPLVLVNSAALPPNLVESELFGYEAGAFTGADRKGRKGKFEAADSGTLFLDEIGDMPLDMQVKMLRVLQDGQFERLGGDRARQSDFRLISASNRDFKSMIASASFRLDLFYRISTVTLRLPALRERLEDIPELVEAFLEAFALRHGAPRKSISESAIRFLQSSAWPGNIRQLQHAVERAAIFCDGRTLSAADFEDLEGTDKIPGWRPAREPDRPKADMRETRERVESEMIVEAMRRTGGNKKRVAEELGISRSYLYKRLSMLDEEEPGGVD